jgi:hypothetical protein
VIHVGPFSLVEMALSFLFIDSVFLALLGKKTKVSRAAMTIAPGA